MNLLYQYNIQLNCLAHCFIINMLSIYYNEKRVRTRMISVYSKHEVQMLYQLKQQQQQQHMTTYMFRICIEFIQHLTKITSF
jgi:hypothetical protein